MVHRQRRASGIVLVSNAHSKISLKTVRTPCQGTGLAVLLLWVQVLSKSDEARHGTRRRLLDGCELLLGRRGTRQSAFRFSARPLRGGHNISPGTVSQRPWRTVQSQRGSTLIEWCILCVSDQAYCGGNHGDTCSQKDGWLPRLRPWTEPCT